MGWRLGEFDRIERYFRPLSAGYEGSLALGDDAAILAAVDEQRVVTTDTMVEGTHFLAGSDPHLLAQKLLRVNLSDLAAMGAKPECYFLNLTLPPRIDETWLQAFSEGLERDQTTFGCHLAGGDSTSTPSASTQSGNARSSNAQAAPDGQLTMTITMIGQVAPGQALRRAGAKPGDAVLVTGVVGDGLLGLLGAMGGLGLLQPAMRDALIKRYNLPNPRVRTGQMLWQHGVRAATDVSDGLLADLGHICRASNVQARLLVAQLPFSKPARAAIEGGYLDAATLAGGGDDYELIFTIPKASVDGLLKAIGEDPTLGGATVIGEIIEVAATQPLVALYDEQGNPVSAPTKGWQHGQD
ncbi:MAG: thiamine-phosphate kinase [Pseudomonadota bacterium]